MLFKTYLFSSIFKKQIILAQVISVELKQFKSIGDKLVILPPISIYESFPISFTERLASNVVTSLKYSSSMLVNRFSGQSEMILNFLSFSFSALCLTFKMSVLLLRVRFSLVLGIFPSMYTHLPFKEGAENKFKGSCLVYSSIKSLAFLKTGSLLINVEPSRVYFYS